MITEYHRPRTLDEALVLLARSSPLTYLMGGGTKLNRPSSQSFEVVDLQSLAAQPNLGLGQILLIGNLIEIGAAVTLQRLSESKVIPESIQPALAQVLQSEATYNLRQVATLGGTIATSNARSAVTTALLAMDASLEIHSLPGGPTEDSLGDFLALSGEVMPGRLIMKIKIPANLALAYAAVSRTPADFPIVSSAVVRWPSGRLRVALGGYGRAPVLVMDGPEAAGADIAAKEAFRQAGDEWASAQYRSAMAEILVRRCINSLQENINE